MNRVRPAGPDDVKDLASLLIEFHAEAGFQRTRAEAAGKFRPLLATPELGQVWLLEADGQPAGFVVLTVCFSMEHGGLRGFIDDLFVRKAFRRRGLASAALEEVKCECVRRGVRALLVETGASNDAALRVYRRAGFAETGHLLLTLPLAAPAHDEAGNEDGGRRSATPAREKR